MVRRPDGGLHGGCTILPAAAERDDARRDRGGNVDAAAGIGGEEPEARPVGREGGVGGEGKGEDKVEGGGGKDEALHAEGLLRACARELLRDAHVRQGLL